MEPIFLNVIEAVAWREWVDDLNREALRRFQLDTKPATDPQDDVILWWPL